MSRTLLEKIVEGVPGAQKRFVRKQGEIATHIWRILSSRKPAWTQRDLARQAKMKESYISHLLSGVANPTLKTLCALEEALGEDIIISPSPRRAKELTAYTGLKVEISVGDTPSPKPEKVDFYTRYIQGSVTLKTSAMPVNATDAEVNIIPPNRVKGLIRELLAPQQGGAYSNG